MKGPEARIFIAGNDDFLVHRTAKKVFDDSVKTHGDACSTEIIHGHAGTVSDVEPIIRQLQESVQTISLFGEHKITWLKNINFLGDNVIGRSEKTRSQIGWLLEVLSSADTTSNTILLSAFPVDRRRKEYKELSSLCQSTFVEHKDGGQSFATIMDEVCKELGTRLTPDAKELLIAKTGGHTRLIIEEIRKLATYLGNADGISEELVAELVPEFGESDFFELVEAFYNQHLNQSLDALRKHFFHHKEARPLLSSLQGRNRLMIQLRVLLESKKIRMTTRGLEKASFEHTGEFYGSLFKDHTHKANTDIFTQNLWYLGKLGQQAQHFSLRQLIHFQLEFMKAFEQILKHPQEQEATMRELVIRCLN